MPIATELAPFVLLFARTLKATHFYEPNHALVRQLVDETHASLAGLVAGRTITLGAVGSSLFAADGNIDAIQVREAAAAVAKHLYQRNVLALRCAGGVTRAELLAFLTAIAPTPDEVRARGGVVRPLVAAGVRSLVPVELDLAALHKGQASELEALVGDDPVAKAAVQRALKLVEKDASGDAVEVGLAAGAGPAELGEFLERLVTRSQGAQASQLLRAKPGTEGAPVRTLGGPQRPGTPAGGLGNGQKSPAKPGTSTPPEAGLAAGGRDSALPQLSADQLARLATDALDRVIGDAQGAASAAKIDAAVKVFSQALAKMPTQAGFQVLRELAHREGEGRRWPEALDGLAKTVSDDALANMLAGALTQRSVDEDALGQIIQRLRPQESRRQELVKQLGALAPTGTSTLLAGLQQRLLDGAQAADRHVPVAYRESLRQLQAAAEKARTQAAPDFVALFQDASPGRTALRLAHAWMRLAREEEGLAGLEKFAVQALEGLEKAGDEKAATQFAIAASEACERATPPRFDVVTALYSGPAGLARADRLLQFELRPRAWVRIALEPLVFGQVKPSTRAKLVAVLQACGEASFSRLLARLPEASPSAVQLLLDIGTGVNATRALALARDLLRSSNGVHKSAALRALPKMLADPAALALLSQAAGAEGEKVAATLLKVDPKDHDTLYPHMLTAVSALGDSRSPAAVAPLEAVLNWKRLLGGKELQPFHRAAADALGVLAKDGVGEALAALEDASKSGARDVRDECRRVLGRPS